MDTKQQKKFLNSEYYALKLITKAKYKGFGECAELYHKKPHQVMEKIDFIFGDIGQVANNLKAEGKKVVVVIDGIAKIV